MRKFQIFMVTILLCSQFLFPISSFAEKLEVE